MTATAGSTVAPRMGTHFIAYLLARGVPGIIGFATLSIYTHLLTPAQYGLYALALAWSTVVAAIGFQWITSGVRRFVSVYAADALRFQVTIGGVYLGFVVASAVLLAIVSWVGLLEGGGKVAILVVGLLWSQSWFDLNVEFALARLRPRQYGVLAISRSLLALACGCLLIALGAGGVGAIWGAAIAWFLPPTIATWREWRDAIVLPPSREMAVAVTQYGLPLAGTFALQFVVNFSDRLLLERLRGAADVGTYAASYDLTQQTLGVLMVAVNLAAFPMTIRAMEREGPEGAKRQLERQGIYLVGIGIPAALGLILVAPALVTSLFGPEFRETGQQVIPVVAVAAFLAGWKGFYFDLAFQLARRTGGQLWITLVAAITVTALNLAWIPRYGPLGAAWATLVAFAVALGLSVVLGRDAFHVPTPVREWAKCGLAALVMAGALWPLHLRTGSAVLIAQVLIGVSVYGVMAIALDLGGLRRVVRATFTGPSA